MNKKDINVKEVLEELQKDVLQTDLIQDNKLHFRCNDNIYRVRMPNQKEQNEATLYKNQSYIKLLQEENTLTIKQLKSVLNKKGIDINEMDKELEKLEKEMMQAYLSLNKKKDNDNRGIKKHKDQLKDIRNKRMDIVLEKSSLLAPAIEYQAQDDYYRYLTAFCTEKFVVKKQKKKKIEEWQNAWNSFEDFLEDRSKLRLIALGRLTDLLLSV